MEVLPSLFNPERGPSAAHAGSSSSSGLRPPLQFTCRGSDGTVHQVDSEADEALADKVDVTATKLDDLTSVIIGSAIFLVRTATSNFY